MTEGRRIVSEYDRKYAESGSDALLTEANDKLSEMAKRETVKALNNVLSIASERMKNSSNLADQ